MTNTYQWVEVQETEFKYYWTKASGWTVKEVKPHYVLRQEIKP